MVPKEQQIKFIQMQLKEGTRLHPKQAAKLDSMGSGFEIKKDTVKGLWNLLCSQGRVAKARRVVGKPLHGGWKRLWK